MTLLSSDGLVFLKYNLRRQNPQLSRFRRSLQKNISASLAGKAEVVVTGDNDLLTLKEYEGVKIISPREFLDLLG